ncbi:MAG TPA: hypothetical protein VMM13_00645, partial [Euzebya sp.]|nr:hypothetical protein [Euzebya sp.]
AVPALALTGSTVDIEPVAQAVLDPQARAAYRTRLAQLSADLDQADGDADLARAERLRLERDALLTELGRATGLGGRDRGFGAPAERARTAVRKALVRVLDDIAAADADLGAHLREAVRTGRECSYDPRPGEEITWTVRAG